MIMIIIIILVIIMKAIPIRAWTGSWVSRK